VTAVSMLHMTRSSKVFATITDANATAPPVPQFAGDAISAVISDCGLAATYMVPSPTNPNFRSFLVTYTWDDDSTKVENTFGTWPQNISPPGPAVMYDAMLNRAYRQNPAPPTTTGRSGGSTRCCPGRSPRIACPGIGAPISRRADSSST
jgi:hypothetical protein